MIRADKLKALVPEAISQLIEFTEIYSTQGVEIDSIYGAVDDIVNQCFVNTATWGLAYWEHVLNIPTDVTKEAAYRRDVILSKIKGVGTVTVSLIDTISESYDNGEIDIIEHPDTYSFEVKFVGTFGLPPNLQDLKDAINNVKPAHLNVTYSIRYFLINQIHNVMNLNDIQSHRLIDFAPFADYI